MGTIVTNGAEFARVAGAITARTAELLRAPIYLIDDRGMVVSRSGPTSDEPGLASPGSGHQNGQAGAIRVPLRIDAHAGEVVIQSSTEAPEPISPRLAQALVDLVVNQVAVVERLPNQHELKNKLINDLLHGAATEDETVLRDAKLLGMDLSPPRAVILIDASDYVCRQSPWDQPPAPEEMRRRSERVVGSVVGFFQLPNDTICVAGNDGEIAVLKASDSKNLGNWINRDEGIEPPSPSWANLSALKRAGRSLLTWLRRDTGAGISIGIGRFHPGIRGLALSYQDARAALSLGRRFHGHNRVHSLDGLGIAALVGLADEQTKISLASHLLSPLDHEPELIESLRVFFEEDCCPSATASRLAIHRNTLSYRFDKVATLSGLDPRRFDDAVQIRLALVLRSLGEATEDGKGCASGG